jgi:hypothetical protein
MNEMIIGCIPVSAHPAHPDDQKNCTIEACPDCGQKMWVSEKKRAIRASGVRCACLLCLALEAIKSGIEPEVIDINKTN